MTEMTYELGLDFRYLTSARHRGRTDHRRVPRAAAADKRGDQPEEAEAVRAFVAAGGRGHCRCAPGVFDGHCKPLETGALDDVFGIARPRATPPESVVQVTRSWRCCAGHRPGEDQLDAGSAGSHGEALATVGDTPVLLVNRFGQGRAILLELPTSRLGRQRRDDVGAAAAGALYRAAGASAPVERGRAQRRRCPLTETRTWRNGDALIVGAYRKMRNAWFNPTSGTIAGEPVAAALTVPAGYHVYDLRAGRYAGEVGRLDATLRWGRANFYALLPYRLQGLSVALSTDAPEPGSQLTVTVGLDVPRAAAGRRSSCR